MNTIILTKLQASLEIHKFSYKYPFLVPGSSPGPHTAFRLQSVTVPQSFLVLYDWLFLKTSDQ